MAGRRGTKNFVDPNKVFCGNLPYDVNSADLKQWFVEQGVGSNIKSCKVIRDWKTKESKGYGFAMFLDPIYATSAIELMKGRKIKNRFIRLHQGKKKKVDPMLFIKNKDKNKERDEEEALIENAIDSVYDEKQENKKEEEEVDEMGELEGYDPTIINDVSIDDKFLFGDADDDDDDDDDDFEFDGVYEKEYYDDEDDDDEKVMNREQRRDAAKKKKRRRIPGKGFGN